MEITEEEEEEQREIKRQSVIEDKHVPGEIDADPARPQSPITGPPVTLDASIASSAKESRFADTTEPPAFAATANEPRPASPAKSAKSFDVDADLSWRLSSQSSRQDYYSSSSYLASKSRVKLGPRPCADAANRPRSSGDTKRPVASMPAGLKLLLKGGRKSKTQDDSSSVISQEASEDTFLASTLTMSDNANRPPSSGGRRPSSSGISVKSMPAISAPTKTAMTPEKLRLMKALQLREKKRRESATSAPAIPSLEVTPSPVPEKPHSQETAKAPPVEIVTALGPSPGKEAAETVDSAEGAHVVQRPSEEENELAADQQSVSQADSAIDVVTIAPTDQTSEHTRSDSRAPSPVCASDVGDSTKASSISKSTDETLQPPGEKADNSEKEEVDVESQAAEAHTADVSTPGADIEAGTALGPAEQDAAPKASLSQTETEQKYAVENSGALEERHANSPPNERLAESTFLPTSKFATKLPSGQAAMDPMEIRGQDPPNVTKVASEPGRIDEADPAPVDPLQRTEDGLSAPSSKWNLPISKYSSTHEINSSPVVSSLIPDIVTSSADASSNGQDAIAEPAVTMVDDGTSDEQRRSVQPEPILTSSVAPIKETSQDGDVAHEQQSATNDNDDDRSSMAMSPTSETPPMPLTPRQGPLRTVSTPVQGVFASAGDAPLLATPSRSISSGSALHQRMNQQPPPSTHLAPGRQPPGKLAGGLASRIKAFEQLAATKAATLAAPPVVSSGKERPSSTFFSIQRQNTGRDGALSPGPSVMSRTNSIYGGRTPTPAGPEESPPESVMGSIRRERSGSVASRLSVFEGGNAPRGKPETVQVTARIVREPGQNYPKAPESNADPTEYSSLNLEQSPLIVDHRKDVETPNPATAAEAAPVPTPLVHAVGEPRRSLQERRLSRDKRSSIDATKDGLSRPGQRTSLTMARDFFRDSMASKDGSNPGRPPSVHLQSNSILTRLSVHTRGKATCQQDSTLLSPTSITEKCESGDEKKEGNRASRLMRRLSSTFSPGRKQSTTSTVTSPVLTEEYAADPEKTPRAATAPPTANISKVVAIMGDVNVQFPENLLWKRRTMSLDSNGFLHLSPNQGAMSSRETQLKRFHMSEFRLPYTPEMEFQELPNSICLDLKTGSGLQVALQDRISQQNVLLGEFTWESGSTQVF